MLGYTASMVTQCGYSGSATVIPFIVANLLSNAGIQFDLDQLIASLSSPQEIQSLVTEYEVDTSILTLESINQNPHVYIAMDKWNTKRNKNLAKFSCWFDVRKNKVETSLLDVDCVGEDTVDIFQDLKYSIQRFVAPNMTEETFTFCGQCTDSGGGGTMFALATHVEKEYETQ